LAEQEDAPGCALCAAEQVTPWYHEDDRCWVAECLICRTPMVVWRRLGDGVFRIDPVMRRIPDHFHAHARDPAWPGFAWR
jgi:hypothetical protein